MRLAGHMACMWAKDECMIFLGNVKVRDQLVDVGVDGRIILK
jgi:hypothetical protein